MKTITVLRLRSPLWLLITMFFFCGCAKEILKITPTSDVSIVPVYTYNWADKKDADTLIFECKQKISYSLNDEDFVISPNAFVKLYPYKDTVFFEGNEKADAVFERETTIDVSEDGVPKINKFLKEFYFDDGQIIKAEIYFESYSLTIGDKVYELPYMNVENLIFVSVSTDEIVNEENIFFTDLDFSFDYNVSTNDEKITKNISTYYIKKRLLEEDELQDVSYSDGYIWHNSKQFSLFVEKNEIWRDKGEQKSTFTSPIIDFYISGKDDQIIEADNIDFEYSENYNLSDVTEINSDGWNIKQYTKNFTINHSNGVQSFSNNFSFPVYEISLSVDGKSFGFDLKQKHSINTKVNTEDDKNTHVTNVNAFVLGRRFEAYVFTELKLKDTTVNPPVEPNPDPDPTPTPEPDKYKYGKVVDCSVTAVYDPDATFSDGKITKKCVMVRFEHGYLWGVCDYQEDFPEEYTYTTAGYSAFNSVAKDDTFEPFVLARAVDVDGGIAWYSENNKLIAGIDILTCKILGWENALNGTYSAFLNSYNISYSNNRYTVTFTAPSGVSKTFYSE